MPSILIKAFADWRSIWGSEALMGLDRRFEIVGRAFQVADCSLFTRKSSTWSRFSKRRNSPEQKVELSQISSTDRLPMGVNMRHIRIIQ